MMYHQPVMLNESIEGLNIRPEGTYVDATFGGGGHSRRILSLLGPEGRLVAFDKDPDAIRQGFNDPRFLLLNEDFRFAKNYLRLHGVRSLDGLLADLGVSSHQFDEAGRGFSTRFDGELDLRMDPRQGLSAKDLVNGAEEEELAKLFKIYGELPNARQMAKAVCKARSSKAIDTTFELCDAVRHLLPRGHENKYLAMLFQALRIEVNGELEALKALLQQAVELLNPGGRVAVISYHSLEDRLVKNFFRTGNFEGKLEKDFYGNPMVPLKPVNRHPITASEEELQLNSRSRSAKLRVAEKPEGGSKNNEVL